MYMLTVEADEAIPVNLEEIHVKSVAGKTSIHDYQLESVMGADRYYVFGLRVPFGNNKRNSRAETLINVFEPGLRIEVVGKACLIVATATSARLALRAIGGDIELVM